MTVTCVYVQVTPEMVQPFTEAMLANHRESVKEPGNLRFDVLQQFDDPTRFMIYEAYVSEEAAAAHKKTAHYVAWRGAVAEMMAAPRTGIKYSILAPVEGEL